MAFFLSPPTYSLSLPHSLSFSLPLSGIFTTLVAFCLAALRWTAVLCSCTRSSSPLCQTSRAEEVTNVGTGLSCHSWRGPLSGDWLCHEAASHVLLLDERRWKMIENNHFISICFPSQVIPLSWRSISLFNWFIPLGYSKFVICWTVDYF